MDRETVSGPAQPRGSSLLTKEPPARVVSERRRVAQFQKIHGKSRPVVSTCVYGLVASLAAVAFQLAINWIYGRCFQSPATGHFWQFAWTSLAVIVVASLIVGWLLNSFSPESAWSGIPQVKLAYWKEFGSAPFRVAFIKFIAGIISIDGGQSLGREGPTADRQQLVLYVRQPSRCFETKSTRSERGRRGSRPGGGI